MSLLSDDEDLMISVVRWLMMTPDRSIDEIIDFVFFGVSKSSV